MAGKSRAPPTGHCVPCRADAGAGGGGGCPPHPSSAAASSLCLSLELTLDMSVSLFCGSSMQGGGVQSRAELGERPLESGGWRVPAALPAPRMTVCA